MALNLGGIIRLTYTVKNDLLAATNPSAATLTIIQPDGTTASPTVTLPPVTTGLLLVDFTPSQAGLHSVHWATTGPTTAEDDMFVAEAPGRMLVSPDEAIAHLRATQTITGDADREQVQWLCVVATDAVERDLGRTLVRQVFTETYDGGQSLIMLRHTPVLSVVSVTVNGVLLTALDYRLDSANGFLYAGTTSTRWYFGSGYGNAVVVYAAGEANPPRVARQAALTLIQSMWQSSQQAFHPALDEASAEVFAQAALPSLSQLPGYNSLRMAGIA